MEHNWGAKMLDEKAGNQMKGFSGQNFHSTIKQLLREQKFHKLKYVKRKLPQQDLQNRNLEVV